MGYVEKGKNLVSASRVVNTLLYPSLEIVRGWYRPTFKENGKTPCEPPYNNDKVMQKAAEVYFQYPMRTCAELSHPYWDAEEVYDPLEVFTSTIQFFDDHEEPLPRTTLPPETDVKQFIEEIVASGKKNTIDEQLAILMKITNGNIIGAANVGLMGSRIMARGSDFRAYPNIRFAPADMVVWNQRVAQFDHKGKYPVSDAPGDTYYFWTHSFASLIYSALNTTQARMFNSAFMNGTKVMTLFRRHIAKQPTISEHIDASRYGRRFGKELAQTFLY